MNKVRISFMVSIVVLLLATSLLVACAAPAPTSTTVITWKHAGLVPEAHWLGKAKLWWISEIDKRTNGRLKIQYNPGGTLTQGPDALGLLNKGVIDSADISSGHVAGELKGVDVWELPGLVPPNIDIRKKVAREMYPDMKKLYEKDYDVVLVAMTQADPRNIYTKKEAKRMADLKGLKLRGQGPNELGLLNGMGATASYIVHTELYTALQQGIMDGTGFLDSAVVSFKLWEVVNYIIPIGYDGSGQAVLVNRTKFNALPSDIQKVITDMTFELQDKTLDFLKADLEPSRKMILEKGMKIIEWPKEDMDKIPGLSKPIWDEWLKNAGPNGKALLDRTQQVIK